MYESIIKKFNRDAHLHGCRVMFNVHVPFVWNRLKKMQGPQKLVLIKTKQIKIYFIQNNTILVSENNKLCHSSKNINFKYFIWYSK